MRNLPVAEVVNVKFPFLSVLVNFKSVESGSLISDAVAYCNCLLFALSVTVPFIVISCAFKRSKQQTAMTKQVIGLSMCVLEHWLRCKKRINTHVRKL